jgi:hypothetical protein
MQVLPVLVFNLSDCCLIFYSQFNHFQNKLRALSLSKRGFWEGRTESECFIPSPKNIATNAPNVSFVWEEASETVVAKL